LNQADTLKAPARAASDKQRRALTHICMHVLGRARTDQRVLREATALTSAGYRVTIVDIESDPARGKTEAIEGVELRHIVMPDWFISTRFKPWFLVKLARILLAGVTNLAQAPADIYHAHDDNALFASNIAARLRRKPLVFDAHELPLVDPHIVRWPTLTRVARFILRQLTQHARATIVVSAPIGLRLRELYGGPPAVVVRNLLPYNTVPRSNRLREYFGLSVETRVALYQGQLAPDRDLDKLVYAAHALPENVVIVLMGAGSSQQPLQRLIDAEGLQARVKLAPFVPYQELLAWTTSADVGLILYNPDFSENVRMCLPNKLFEYVMAGLPVLASPLVAVREILEEYQVGRIAERLDPASFGAAIGAMANDTAALEMMRRNELAAARGDLNWEAERWRLVDLYDRLVAERAATAHSQRKPGAKRI